MYKPFYKSYIYQILVIKNVDYVFHGHKICISLLKFLIYN